MEKTATLQQALNKEPEYFLLLRVYHPANVPNFVGLVSSYVQRRGESNFGYHWFVYDENSTVVAMHGNRNSLTFIAEYISQYRHHLPNGHEVVYRGRGAKTFKSLVDYFYPRHLGYQEGRSQ